MGLEGIEPPQKAYVKLWEQANARPRWPTDPFLCSVLRGINIENKPLVRLFSTLNRTKRNLRQGERCDGEQQSAASSGTREDRGRWGSQFQRGLYTTEKRGIISKRGIEGSMGKYGMSGNVGQNLAQMVVTGLRQRRKAGSRSGPPSPVAVHQRSCCPPRRAAGSTNANGEQHQQPIPVLAPADVQNTISLIQAAYAPSAATDVPQLQSLQSINPCRERSKQAVGQVVYTGLVAVDIFCAAVRARDSEAPSQVPLPTPSLLRMHTALCEVLVRSLLLRMLHSIRASLPSSTYRPRRFCPSMSVRRPIPDIPRSVVTHNNDFAGGFPLCRLRAVFYALECSPTPGECALTRAAAPSQALQLPGPTRLYAVVRERSVRRLIDSYTENPALVVNGQAGARIGIICDVLAAEEERLYLLIRMHLNTRTPDARSPTAYPAAGHADLFAVHAEAHARLVGVQTQTPLILAESMMRTTDSSALDEATVSALKRRVHAPPGKTMRTQGHVNAIERAPRGCVCRAGAVSELFPAIAVLRAVGTLVLWCRAVRPALPTSIFICPAFIYPAIFHR
ncbi:hypothetical protein DFH06DRAFT_1133747 [Mycena polygramma]|nr:hypothetical protein DFH06DRAFT_1133747 [Mycena polygramma]